MTSQSKQPTSERLQSLDVLRGFDMFWITGGASLVVTLAEATHWSFLESLVPQMEHAEFGKGFHFLDLIFPLFMFMSGVAIPYAITAKAEKDADKFGLWKKAFKRAIILVILGVIYNGVLRKGGFEHMRVASVLGQIGLGYLFAATIVLYTNSIKPRIAWLVGILLGITILHLFVPVPGFGAGHIDKVEGINAWFDRMFLPGSGTGADPEGILCIVSAISVTLMGAIAGAILRDGKPASQRKATILAISGASLIIIALLLHPFYPIIKYIWTTPFNLLTAGISCMLLSLFYFVIDVKQWTKGAMHYIILYFKVIGMNSITIYLATHFINFGQPGENLLGWLALPLGDWVFTIGYMVAVWLFLYFLYKNKIFLRV